MHRAIARHYKALAELHEKLAKTEGSDWVDQSTSPLGRRRHCALVRSGVIPGRKHGRRFLARREDIEAFIEREGQPPGLQAEDDEDEQLLRRAGARRVA